MRRYSEAAVLIEYLEETQIQGFWGRLATNLMKNSRKSLVIQVPKRFYVKNKLICETIQEEIEGHFNQSDLVNHLVQEVLSEYSFSPSPIRLYEQFRQISLLPIVNRSYSDEKDLCNLTVLMKKKDILRLEMFLLDAEEIEDHPLTVEKLLELKYIEMCDQVLDGQRDIIKEIIEGD
ncbi:hypothetical protein [Metabacillus fastidiosus]|uniref:hypothetical protein n=1 Tax=Metabacillus fastidiosus TaxID=1458 RepID=UPI002E1F6E92|nr:hypothetical protein [Metabacillus fastidiosus]